MSHPFVFYVLIQQPDPTETMCSYLRLQSGNTGKENESEENWATVAAKGPI